MAAANQDADQTSNQAPLDRALSMLVEALQILDAQEVPPELGARLQGVIEDLNDYAAS
ncbi:hypothetical protein LZ016_01940 [Sphingomonas sp. SM33]|uniref:Uncharacterized protein n=1 Tax=Sphingomonas telluris TaxID=2907998 RepID=A0ABS9VJH9_9SPHN|nr:hypothetical protein [Sphingomonas telluris]MCH8614868.1 hypothetical protein [Sphingomonas telluris]